MSKSIISNDVFDSEDFPSPNVALPFDKTVLQCGALFMTKKQICSLLNMEEEEVNKRCWDIWNMSLDRVLDWCYSRADVETRSTLKNLMAEGSNSATAIYTKYIAKVDKEEESKTNTINVVLNVPKDDEDED